MGTCFLIKQNDDRMKRKRREALQNLQTCNFFFLLKNTKRSFFFFLPLHLGIYLLSSFKATQKKLKSIIAGNKK